MSGLNPNRHTNPAALRARDQELINQYPAAFQLLINEIGEENSGTALDEF